MAPQRRRHHGRSGATAFRRGCGHRGGPGFVAVFPSIRAHCSAGPVPFRWLRVAVKQGRNHFSAPRLLLLRLHSAPDFGHGRPTQAGRNVGLGARHNFAHAATADAARRRRPAGGQAVFSGEVTAGLGRLPRCWFRCQQLCRNGDPRNTSVKFPEQSRGGFAVDFTKSCKCCRSDRLFA